MSRLGTILVVGLCLGLAACKRDDGAAAPKVPVVAPQSEGIASAWGSRKLSELDIAVLIEVLDTVAREHTGLDQEAAKLLLGKLGGGPPATMGVSSWHHFLNSGLNALGATHGVSADAIAQVLLPMVEEGSDKVVRLYALQHLGIHQPRASEPLRSQIGRRVLELREVALTYDKRDRLTSETSAGGGAADGVEHAADAAAPVAAANRTATRGTSRTA